MDGPAGPSGDQIEAIKAITKAQRDGRTGRALRDCRKAISRWPEEPRFYLIGAGLLLDQGDKADALPLLLRLAELTPEDAKVHASIGEVHRSAGRLQDALDAYDRSLAVGHDRPEIIHRFRGSALAELRRPSEAVIAFRHSLDVDDRHAETWFEMGVAAQRTGDRRLAFEAYDRAIAVDADHGQAWRMRANLVSFTADDPSIAQMETALTKNEQAGGDGIRQSMHIGFGLAKAYDDLDDPDHSFAALKQANDRKRAALDYDVAGEEDLARRVRKVFGHDTFVRLHGVGVNSERPVFVVGMPRSGTTLVEQVLASHSAVYGAGEIPYLMRIALAPRKDVHGHRSRNNTAYRGSSYLSMEGTAPDDVPFPDYIHEVGADGIAYRANSYLKMLEQVAPDSQRVVDKTPVNFMFVGLIRLLFPKARIINCVRDPMDTCFSCYKRHFSAGPSFAYNLEDLGRYYRVYSDMMDHWRAVIPETILDVVYEDLVADFQTHARRLIDFVSLDWEDACLEFHKTDRVIDTASNMQVRQPIHDTSIGAWRRYEAHLGPLKKALERS